MSSQKTAAYMTSLAELWRLLLVVRDVVYPYQVLGSAKCLNWLHKAGHLKYLMVTVPSLSPVTVMPCLTALGNSCANINEFGCRSFHWGDIVPFIEQSSIPLRFRDWSETHWTHFYGMGCYYCPWLDQRISNHALLVICVLTNGGQVNLSWSQSCAIFSPHERTHSYIWFCS